MVKSKNLLLIVIVLFLSAGLTAQKESFMGLCLGTALPQGTFADKDFQTEGAGYANTGFLFTFDGSLFPDEYLGFGATVTYGSNNPDKTQYKEDLYNDILTRYPAIEDYEDQIYFDFGVWRYLNIHAGPAFTVPAGRINFDFRTLAGLTLAWAPDQLLEVQWEPDNAFSRKVNDKATPTLGYTVGTGVRYALRSGYVFRLILEYSNSKPTMEVVEDLITGIAEGSGITTTEYKMPIKNVQIGIGIAYNFEL